MAATILPRQVPKAVPTLLSFVAGYIDSVTFLGLYGIFIAQMTGSFVLAGTQFVASEQGYLVKLLAIPVFFAAAASRPRPRAAPTRDRRRAAGRAPRRRRTART